MPRSVLAYLSDIVTACDDVANALKGVDVDSCATTPMLRAAVERQSTIIGEAMNSISRMNPELATRISHARKIVGFRNLLAHDYPAIVDEAVWAITDRDVPVLREECSALIEELSRTD